MKLSSRLRILSERLMHENGFQGVPTEDFEESGRLQFMSLLKEGLVPESRVLDIGCGVLRLGYWLIRFLDAGCYFGIEPAKGRVDLGRKYLFSQELLRQKSPHFDFNETFDTGVFDQKFEYFIAGSIWTHCDKHSIRIMLDGFIQNSTEDAVFLTSFIPATSDQDDYMGSGWVGTSHKSEIAGVIRHSRFWLEQECESRKLNLTELSPSPITGQHWLGIRKLF